MSLIQYNLILLYCIFVSYGSGHKCYICGGDNEITCDNFNPSNIELYTRECPPGSHGCSLQKSDGEVIRSCEFIRLDDCKTANNVNYCYCSKSLCNSNILKHATPANYDDEDDGELEGSGSNTETASEKAITPKLNKTTTQIIETNAVDSSDFLRPTVYTLFIALYVYIIIS